MKFRVRHAYLGMKGESHQLLFGQYWDLFSPLGPTTLNTNGYMWQTGNLGFRRAQFRFTYLYDPIELGVSISDPTDMEKTYKGLPVFMGRIGANLGEKKNYKVGVSFVGAQGTYSYADEVVAFENDETTWGVSFDWMLPLVEGLSFKGEAATGENLNIFLSRAGVYTDVAGMSFEPVGTTAIWAQLVYKFDEATVWGGYATEMLESSEIGSGSLEDTAAIFVGMLYSLGAKTSLGAEYTFFDSTYKDTDNGDTNQFQLSWIYKF